MDTIAEFTYDEAVTLLDRAVEERGADFVYKQDDRDGPYLPKCFYHRNGGPDCIIGLILFYKGVTPEQLRELDGCDLGAVGDLIDREYIKVDSQRTRDLLTSVQFDQDRGHPWGKAVSSAKVWASDEVRV